VDCDLEYLFSIQVIKNLCGYWIIVLANADACTRYLWPKSGLQSWTVVLKTSDQILLWLSNKWFGTHWWVHTWHLWPKWCCTLVGKLLMVEYWDAASRERKGGGMSCKSTSKADYVVLWVFSCMWLPIVCC